MRAFFDRDLDTVATFWRIYRRDGAMLAFTSHDRDLAFDGITHCAAPGMLPAAIRLTADLNPDDAEVEGAVSHASITAGDLSAGLFDAAQIEIGAVAWEALERRVLYSGSIGSIADDANAFSAELVSAKRALEQDLVPRTSPTCRAAFCGPGCNLSARDFTTTEILAGIDLDNNRVQVVGKSGPDYAEGRIRFLSGPQTGIPFAIVSADGGWFSLDRALVGGTLTGTRIELKQGCDHTIQTCNGRFGNAKNFRGEPFLPGNDLLARYGQGGS